MFTQEFRDLAKHAARRTAPANYDLANVDEAFREELSKYCGSIPQFMKNRYDLFEIIMEQADEIVPANVIALLGQFAEIVQIGQGQRKMFKTSKLASKLRARKFLTQVGLAGVYETFRLDRDVYEVRAHAVGGAVTIDFERMLDGEETLAEVMDVITEGLTNSVFMEVQKALRSLVSNADMPTANKVVGSSYDGDALFKLVSIVKAYGGGSISSNGAVIFAPPEFIAAMGPDAIVPVPSGGAYGGVYHPQDIDAIHNTGYINLFRGTPIVQIPQSFVDTNNEMTYIDPTIAYVLPTGGEKVVKVVLEGNTQMYDHVNRDNSMEIQVYKKMGAAILTLHNIAIYENTDIDNTLDPSLGYSI